MDCNYRPLDLVSDASGRFEAPPGSNITFENCEVNNFPTPEDAEGPSGFAVLPVAGELALSGGGVPGAIFFLRNSLLRFPDSVRATSLALADTRCRPSCMAMSV